MNEYQYIENLLFDFFMSEAVNEIIYTKDQAKEIEITLRTILLKAIKKGEEYGKKKISKKESR